MSACPRELTEQDLADVRQQVRWAMSWLWKGQRSRLHDDVLSDAMFAAYRASQDWDPERGRWEPHLNVRVRQRILDGIRPLLARMNREACSLDELVPAGGGEPDMSRGDFVADPVNIVDELVDQIALGQFMATVGRLLEDVCSGHQRAVIEARLAGRALAAIAADRGVTESAVSHTVRIVCRKLHEAGVERP